MYFYSNIPSGTKPKAAFVDGATAPTTQSNAGGESDLDFEIAYRQYPSRKPMTAS